MNQRQINILDLLSSKKKLNVNTLAEQFDVSAVTIRKDLDTLEENGLLRREHGYAIINNEDNINFRLAFGYQEKTLIAKKAASLIEPNETVMIESGSSCALLALEIAKRNQNNTIVTNSTFIPRYLKDYPMTKIIVLGGEYQNASEANIGPLVTESLKLFNIEKLFIGTDGIHPDFGFTSLDYDRAETVKLMKSYAKKTYVLSESSKINESASYQLFPLEQAQSLITDDQISSKELDILEEHNLKVK